MDTPSFDTTELIDIVTFDVIRPEHHIRTTSGDFDIETLYRYYYDNKLVVPLDPYNRQPLSTEHTQRVIKYADTQQIAINIIYLGTYGRRYTTSFKVQKHKTVGSIICHMLTNISYIHRTTSDMRSLIEYDFIANDGQLGQSLYDMELEMSLPLLSTTTTVTLDLIKASNSKMNGMIQTLATFVSTREYDTDANYMAIKYYCQSYKPRMTRIIKAQVNPTKKVYYNEQLDRYFYVDTGAPVHDLD